MPQRSVRFPDDLVARADAEAARLDRPFSWLVVQALEAMLPDETPRPSPAGREAKTDVATTPARPAATARPGASRPVASPRTSAIPSREVSAAELDALDADLVAGEQMRGGAPAKPCPSATQPRETLAMARQRKLNAAKGK